MKDPTRGRKMNRVAGWFVTCTVLLGGCSLITGVGEDRRMGAIGYPNDLSISTPDSATAGQAFTVAVRTFGSDGCWRDDGTDVEIDGLHATVTPYDTHRVSRGTYCTQMPVEITHTADLTFGQAGAAQVSIRGRDGTATRTVTVHR